MASLAAGFVLGMCTLLRVMWKCLRTWSFPAVLVQDFGLFFWRSRRCLGLGGLLGNSEDLEEPNKCFYVPRYCLRVAVLFIDVFPMSVALETACGVMTKPIELNTTVSTKKCSVACDARCRPAGCSRFHIVLRGAGLILASRSGFALSTLVRDSFQCHFLHLSLVADTVTV